MKKIFLILPILIFSLFLAFTPQKALAAYDSNLVISDAQLTAKNTMSEQQIQDFLVAKGSFLANFTVPAPRTVTYYIDSTRTLTTYENTTIGPYGVSTEVDVRGWRASRVIWQVCQWYGVNPQVALTIIEKESTFILGRTSGRSDGSIAVPGANSYATYAWLMGYAYTEDVNNPAKNVCGVATPGANPNKSCAGFAAQLDNGIWAVANWMNLANIQSTGNDYGCGAWGGSYRTDYTTRLCDGEWITPRSGATAALYRYTPHTGLTGGYSGNRAFYLIYNNWFGDGLTVSQFYLSDLRPAAGMMVNGSYVITNNTGASVTLDSVGLAGRLNTWDSGIVRDFGWQPNVTIAAGEAKPFAFSTPIYDVGKITVWPCFKYVGVYRDSWKGFTDINSHFPNLTVNNALWVSPVPSMAGQSSYYEITVKNHESSPILYGIMGIAVRGTNGTSFDPVWSYGGTIPANGGQKTISGNSTISQAGTYWAWASVGFAGSYMAIPFSTGGVSLSYAVAPATASFSFSSFWLSNLSPARGEMLRGAFQITNNTPLNQSINGIGLVSRPGSVNSGINRDLGWYADVAFKPWETKIFDFASVVRDPGLIYLWPALNYRGTFSYFQQGLTVANTHAPKLTSVGSPEVAFTPYYVYANNNFTATIALRNDEGRNLYLDGIGIAARDAAGNNADLGWTTPVQIAPGQVYTLPLIRKLPKPGMYIFWGADYIWPYYDKTTGIVYKPVN